ncbi:hypothetical protein [Krasilnikovia sp. MM14-A1004]|uniref:hypothetical protein n=1 Tax=Krasilnikovia sp. MM14-A1004 TaxID=3373541 RepID=UPI00399CDAF2
MTASVPTDGLVEALMGCARRATLPFQEAERPRHFGTAFWYNHLIQATPRRDIFTQYLITAEALTTFDLATFTVRPELGDPAPSADILAIADFRTAWTRLPELGIALMPAAMLHAYADRKGWRWNTHEITDGLAARESDIATIGRTPVEAYVLGHDVGEGQEREQGLAVGAVVLDGRGRLRWNARMPVGCVGAPVFISVPVGGGQYRLVCLGVVLPGESDNEITPFDRIRTAVAAITPRPSRWWKRRKS